MWGRRQLLIRTSQVLGWDLEGLLVGDEQPLAKLHRIPEQFEDCAQYQATFRPLLLQEIHAHLIQSLEYDGEGIVCELDSVCTTSDVHKLELKIQSAASTFRENVQTTDELLLMVRAGYGCAL